MTDKQRFFALDVNDRRRIGCLVAGIAVVHIAQFWIAPPDTMVSRWGGIAANVLALFWTLRPHQAPSFWFGILPFVWWIAALFDGSDVVLAVQESRASSPTALLSAASVLMLPFLAGPLLRFYRLSKGTKSTADTPRSV